MDGKVNYNVKFLRTGILLHTYSRMALDCLNIAIKIFIRRADRDFFFSRGIHA